MRRLDTLLVLLSLTALIGLGGGMVASAPLRPSPFQVHPPLPTSAPPSELIEGVVGPLVTLDPLFASAPAERSIAALLFRGLVRIGPENAVLPDLASSWSTDDGGSSYTFELRRDARWHDGRPVTAADVVGTWATLTDPAYDGPAAGRWTDVTVEPIDRLTVRFRFPLPLAGYLVAMSQPIAPAHVYDKVPVGSRGLRPVGRAPTGNGPFSLESVRGDEVLLTRPGPPLGGASPTFAPGPLASAPQPTSHAAPAERARVDRYRFRVYPDEAGLAAAFAAGEVDVAAGLAPSDATRLAADPGTSALVYPTSRVISVVPNLRSALGAFSDAAVRRALSSAIDRDRIVDDVFGGAGTGVLTPVTPTSDVFDASLSGEPVHDPDGARVGLASAGWTEGPGGWQMPEATTPVSIELLVVDPSVDPTAAQVAEHVAEDWRSIGIDVEVTELPPIELVEQRLRPGEFEAVVLSLEVGLEPDLHSLLISDQAVVGGTNIGAYESSLMDRLLEDARLAADDATRVQRWRDLQATLVRELPLISICFPDDVAVVHGRLQGAVPRAIQDPGDRYWDVLTWRLASGPDE